MDYDYGMDSGTGAIAGGMLFIWLLVAVFFVVCYWRIYTKAGKPGWAVLIPIYSTIVLLEIVGKPIWWFLLLLIPFVNIIFLIIVINELSKAFGKGVGMTLLLIFLPFIGAPMLAFGDAHYTRPATAASVA